MIGVADSLEGDGFIFHLFNYIWMKDPVLGFGFCIPLLKTYFFLGGIVPNLNIPDTILFKYNKPYL